MPTRLATSSTRESHLAAAKALVLTTISQETWQTVRRSMSDAVLGTNPSLRPLKPAFDQFFEQYVTLDELSRRLAPIYAETFTELELRQMIWFYSTDTGKKALSRLPETMTRSGEVGRQIVEDHQADLERILRDYTARHPTSHREY